MKKKLRRKSQDIVDRYLIHRERCLKIKEHFGRLVANEYHQEFKGKPDSPEAEVTFNQFMRRLN